MKKRNLNRLISAITSLVFLFSVYNCLRDSFINAKAVSALTTIAENKHDTDEKIENPFNNQDNMEIQYDSKQWKQPKEWNCPAINPKDYDGGIMLYFDKIGLEPDYAKGKEQRVYFSITGATEPVSHIKFHIFYDTRLTVTKNINGEFVTPGKALKGFTTGSAMVEKGQLAFYASSEDTLLNNSSLFTIDFVVPDNAGQGEVYPFGISYVNDGVAYDTFLNSEQNDAGKLQMTYVFTKGIYNGYIKINGDRTENASGTYHGLKYETSDGEICITGHTSDLPSEVVIPAEINGVPVTSIGVSAFSYCKDLTSIKIPDSVTTIDEGAFIKCTNLTSITIPDSVTTIGENAFSDCTNLTGITIPKNVTNIGGAAFNNCTSMTEITIPKSVKVIDDFTFEGCEKLTSVTISDGVKSIGYCAFSDCKSLSSITIPDSVISIGEDAFTATPWLEAKQKENPLVIVNSLLIDGKACSGDVTIPNGVTSIGDRAFEECNSLTGITIPDSVTSIGDLAFYKCRSLISITIPKSVTSIGYEAFLITPWLEAKREENPFVIINNLLIDGKACSGDVTIPDGVTRICYYAFDECDDLRKITIPESVTNIDEGAFNYCSNLTSVTIPESVTCIGPTVFYECHKLTDITIPKSWTSIAYQEFEGCSSLTEITIPDGVTSIGGQAFMNCKSLADITIPDSVTSIGTDAFSATPWLEAKQKENPLVVVNNILVDGKTCSEDVTIPDGVTSINAEAFKECTDLISITIPDSVKNIGDQAFYGCKNLIIKGYSGSYAETFAKEHHISFKPLEKATAAATTTTTVTAATKPVTSTTRVTTSVATGTAKPVEPKSGDVNNDGKINAVDASTILTYYANISTNKNGGFTEAQKKAADVDKNGDINAVDASYILSYYAYTSTTKDTTKKSIEDFLK